MCPSHGNSSFPPRTSTLQCRTAVVEALRTAATDPHPCHRAPLSKPGVQATIVGSARPRSHTDPILPYLLRAPCRPQSRLLPLPRLLTPFPTPRPLPMPTPTPVLRYSTLMPLSEWTAENPATFEEIEAELGNYRGQSLNVVLPGAAPTRRPSGRPISCLSQQRFGIQIVEDSPVEYAKIRSMAATGNVTWDVDRLRYQGRIPARAPRITWKSLTPGYT